LSRPRSYAPHAVSAARAAAVGWLREMGVIVGSTGGAGGGVGSAGVGAANDSVGVGGALGDTSATGAVARSGAEAGALLGGIAPAEADGESRGGAGVGAVGAG